MRSSTGREADSGGATYTMSAHAVNAVVAGAICALFAVVLVAGPGVIGLIVAGGSAAAALGAMWSSRRVAGARVDDDSSGTAASNIVAGPSSAGTQVGVLRSDDTVSAFVISLARRNGGLVDQQLALIDTLEASVEDPVLLANYFKLDHLATRMRRNADSLLVLAGVDRPGFRSPQDIDEVIRAGISEVEDYRRIDVLALEDVLVTGAAATTLGHLVAELLDNATSFSPPQARVRVAGNAVVTGYEILIADSGVGISEVRIDDFNTRLSRPPEPGSTGDSSIGLTVVAMLAARVGATVALSSGGTGGTVATIHIPNSALHNGSRHVDVLSEMPTTVKSVVPSASALSVPADAVPVQSMPVQPAAFAGPAADATPANQAADAIARLVVTASGLPIRTTSPTSSEPDGDDGSMSWPPPPPPLRTTFGTLQVAESNDPRPVVAAQPDRIGAAMASFARQRGTAWDAPDVADRTTS